MAVGAEPATEDRESPMSLSFAGNVMLTSAWRESRLRAQVRGVRFDGPMASELSEVAVVAVTQLNSHCDARVEAGDRADARQTNLDFLPRYLAAR